MSLSRYHLNLNQPDKTIVTGQLQMGGHDPLGNTLGVNNYYLTRNDQPFFVISGEFHFARYPEKYWADALLKIKAGGINTVSIYVFWIYHEEKIGVFDWSGRKNLRGFIELCAQHELNVVLRVGPFVHAEWRNGGLPDWLYGQPFDVRSNDPRYLAHVERFYTAIAGQVRGQFFAEGGPIIGLQIENEYMHSSAPWEVIDPWREPEWIDGGHDGVAHLVQLKAIAERAGLIAPYTFITAWGGAPIIEDETLPVYAEYAYPTWIDTPTPSDAYIFHDRHALPVDQPTHRVPNYYPYIMAEHQGGIQVRYNNRPVVPARSIEAMAVVRLGEGCNYLGYYMYHGGTTPRGSHGFSAERLHPQLSYDVQAPIGEYGQLRDSYRYLKLLHLFLETYGQALAPLGTRLPAETLKPSDTTLPRYAARTANGSGFLFVNNFQDHVTLQDLTEIVFELDTPRGIISLPETGSLTIKQDTCFILPINQALHGARLLYATAQPLTIVHSGETVHYFYFAPNGIEPEFCFDQNSLSHLSGDIEQTKIDQQHVHIQPVVGRDHSFTFVSGAGALVRITTLTRPEAEHTWKGVAWGHPRVIVCQADLIFAHGGVQVTAQNTADQTLTVFPAIDTTIQAHGARLAVESLAFSTRLQLHLPVQPIALQIEPGSEYKYFIHLPADAWRNVNDIFLSIEYEGDTGMAFVNGELIADNYCNGQPWLIGLKRFAPDVLEHGVCLVFRPARQSNRSQSEETKNFSLHNIEALPEYTIQLPPE